MYQDESFFFFLVKYHNVRKKIMKLKSYICKSSKVELKMSMIEHKFTNNCGIYVIKYC